MTYSAFQGKRFTLKDGPVTSEEGFLAVIRLRIRRARFVRSLRQEEAAQLVGMEQRSYQRFEALKPDRGRFNPSVLTLRRIASGLDIDLVSLLKEPSAEELEALAKLKPHRVRRTHSEGDSAA